MTSPGQSLRQAVERAARSARAAQAASAEVARRKREEIERELQDREVQQSGR